MNLIEVRRNPELNKKISNIIDYLNQYNQPNTYVRFTDHPKLELSTKFESGDTPYGIYGWPIELLIYIITPRKPRVL